MSKPYVIPPKEDLERLYLKELQSLRTIGKTYGNVDNKTVRRWMNAYAIPVREVKEAQRMTAEAINAKRVREKEHESTVTEGEIIEAESDQQEERSGGWLEPADRFDSIEEVSPWAKLTEKQVDAVVLLSSYDPDSLKLTDEQRCEQLGIGTTTLKRWRKDVDFNACLEEAKTQSFKSELKDLSRADLINRYRGGDRLTQEDRKLAFDLTGELDNNINVNYNVLNFFRDPRMGKF